MVLAHPWHIEGRVKSKTLTLSLSFVAILALGCDQGGSSLDTAELAQECPSDFLAEYETEQLDESWDQLMLEAEAYDVTVETDFDLTDVSSICLDYKAQYDADKAALDDSQALVEEAIAEAKAVEENAVDDAVLAAGASRVDRSSRWVTYEFAEGEVEDGDRVNIEPGWITYIMLHSTEGNWFSGNVRHWAPLPINLEKSCIKVSGSQIVFDIPEVSRVAFSQYSWRFSLLYPQ